MPEFVTLLADLGASVGGGLWRALFAWTGLALLAEALLWRGRFSPTVGLWTRGSVLASLPSLLVVPPLLAPWVPSLMSPVAHTPEALPAPLALEASSAGSEAASGVNSLGDAIAGSAFLVGGGASLVALVVVCGGLVWLHRLRRELLDVDAEVRFAARDLSERLGIRRAVRVTSAPPATSPFTLGWRRPIIAVPDKLRDEPLRFALAHELAHIRHSHFAWHLAERVLRALFVWHPMVHVLARGLALDRERVADATVLRLWPTRAKAYGHLLLAFASQPSPRLALGSSSPPLLHRLSSMTQPRPERPRIARFSGLAIFALPLLLAAAALPDEPPTPLAPEAYHSTDEAPSDTLTRYIRRTRVQKSNGAWSIQIELEAGTPRSIATTIADHYSEGGDPGSLTVRGDDFVLERATIRDDAFPPPPPPPPARIDGDRPPPPPPPPARQEQTPPPPPPAESAQTTDPPPPPPPPAGSAHGVLRYAGIDVARLTPGSRDAFVRAYANAPKILAADNAEHGTVQMEYLIDPDGTTRQFRVLSGPPGLHAAAVSLAERVVLADDARPGAPRRGTLTLWYTAR